MTPCKTASVSVTRSSVSQASGSVMTAINGPVALNLENDGVVLVALLESAAKDDSSDAEAAAAEEDSDAIDDDRYRLVGVVVALETDPLGASIAGLLVVVVVVVAVAVLAPTPTEAPKAAPHPKGTLANGHTGSPSAVFVPVSVVVVQDVVG